MKGQSIVKHLKVVNDTAERDIKLIEDYYESTTKDEGQKQYVLLVVAECQKLFLDTLKFTLLILIVVNQFGNVNLLPIALLQNL